MTLVDANLLVYAAVSSSDRHEEAREWLESLLGARERVGLPWASLLAFVRIVTSPRIFERPLGLAAASSVVEAWLARPNVWVPEPGERHWAIVRELLDDGGYRPDLVPDAHLAAIAVEHGLVVASTDGDFARFPGVRWENPLRRRGRVNER